MSDLACTARSLAIQVGMDTWATIHREASAAVAADRLMAGPVDSWILRHASLPDALACNLARKLADDGLSAEVLSELIGEALENDPDIIEAAAADLAAVRERDPACTDLLTPFLFFKGFQAIQAYRISHWLWLRGRTNLARYLQSRVSEVFAGDIHPGARIGRGIMVDHLTGLVIGETAVVEDDVSMLHEVTLGGTGKDTGDRHPKVRRGVLISAGAKILGNIEIGEGAKVGAGSIVLDSVAPYTTVVGVPARPVGPRNTSMPALTMDQMLPPYDWVI